MGCNGAVGKSLLASPICKLHDCLRWWLFPHRVDLWTGAHVYLAISVYLQLRFHVLMSSSLPVSLIDLTSLPLFAASLPFFAWVIWSAWVIFFRFRASLPRWWYRLDVQHLVLMPVYVPSLNPSQLLDLKKGAPGLKLLYSVTKGFWPIQMWCCTWVVMDQWHEMCRPNSGVANVISLPPLPPPPLPLYISLFKLHRWRARRRRKHGNPRLR